MASTTRSRLVFQFGEIHTVIEYHVEDEEEFPSASTGSSVVWPCAILLSEYISRNAPSFSQRSGLELGAGLGLCGLVAARTAQSLVFTDKSPDVVQLLQRNLARNELQGHVCQLEWSNEADIARARALCPLGFDFVLASDVIYNERTPSPFWVTVNALLSAEETSRVYFAHSTRADCIDKRVLECARDCGFEHEELPLSSITEHVPHNEYVPKESLHFWIFKRRASSS